MDRNLRHSGYSCNSGPRSLPHVGVGSKRHAPARLSPPSPSGPPGSAPDHTHNNQHDDLIHYIYDSWNKVNREVERGSEDAKYYQEVVTPRQLANFRPFNLEEWWGRRLVQNVKRQQHRS